jgi:hypothetical protein
MLTLVFFFIFVFLVASAWLFFKCKLEAGDISSAFDLFSSRLLNMLNPINLFKNIGLSLSKIFQLILKKRKDKKEKEISIQEKLEAREAEEILKNEVSEQTIKAMGIDFRELRELAEAEQKFRSKVVKHIVNNRLIYKEGGRLKMVVPLEAMTFLHKNLSPLVNNKGEITLSIKEEKCKIMLDEIDDIDFKEYIMMNGLNEQIYNNRAERDTAINTAKIFYAKSSVVNASTLSNSNLTENTGNDVKQSEVFNTTEREKEDKLEKVNVIKINERGSDEILQEEISKNPQNKNTVEEKKDKKEITKEETKKSGIDFLDDIMSVKPKVRATDIQTTDAKTVLTEVLKEDDDDYNVKKEISKEKKSVTAMKKQFSLLGEFGDQDIEKLMNENIDEMNAAIQASGITPKTNPQESKQPIEHKIEIGVSETDMDVALGAVKEDKVKGESLAAGASEDEMQQAFSQMAEETMGGWGDESEENVFSIDDFKAETPVAQNQLSSSTAQSWGDNTNESGKDDDIGEISKASKKDNTSSSKDRTIELVHNKPFGQPGGAIENVDFKKSFSMYFKKNADLRKALAINIVKTKPIILNDNKQFMFISEYQLGAALCKLFAPDEEKYYQLLEGILKNPQNKMVHDKFWIECKDTLNSLSKNEDCVLTSRNIETGYFTGKQGKLYSAFGWRVKPEAFQIAFEGIQKSDDVLSYARWLSEPLNDNISIAKNYSIADKEKTKPLIPKLDSSIFE